MQFVWRVLLRCPGRLHSHRIESVWIARGELMIPVHEAYAAHASKRLMRSRANAWAFCISIVETPAFQPG